MPQKSHRSIAAWTCGASTDERTLVITVTQRYRWIIKPLVFAASLLPLLSLTAGAFEIFGLTLGADPVKEILHSLGRSALNCLLLTLAVTPLRRLTGWAHVIRLRRMLGLFAFFYAALHLLAYLWLDRGLDFLAALGDVAKRPYITLGFIALLLLIPLALTSTNRMMRRLGRRWQTLHRLVYPIAVLAVWHFYWQVKRDIREPLIYAGILALLLGYRLVRRYARPSVRSPAPTLPSARIESST